MARLIDEFKVGRIVTIGDTAEHFIPLGERDGGFLPVQGRTKTINGITCSWLPYAPGKIAWEELTGRDVLSGKFSGCWMVVYNWYGMTRVAHMGTTEPASAATVNVHKEWDNLRRDHPGCVLRAFEPYSPNRDPLPAATNKDIAGRPAWFGLVTSLRECYSITTYPQQNNPNTYRIVDRRVHREALNPAGPHPMT